MINQFNFYKSYMDNISNLTHTEAGQYLKKLLEFMFRDKEFDELATDKITSMLLLLSDDLKADKERELAGNHTPTSNERRFAFRSVYANIFFCLKDADAGILIKQICDYMFGGSLVTAEETKSVKSYFSAIKIPLSKSKSQSERAKMNNKKPINEPVTLDKIRSDYPFITGYLRAENSVLEGINLNELYAYIKDKQSELQGQNMYSVVLKFKEHCNGEVAPN